MGYFEDQNKLFIGIIINTIKEHKKIEYEELISNLALDSGKSEDTVIKKIKLLKKAKRIMYIKKGDKIFICLSEQKQ